MTTTVPKPASTLGLAGLTPFLALSLLVLATSGETGAWALRALVLYGAVILSFLGGCRWGFAAAGMGAGPTLPLLGLSVAPALAAWAAVLFLPMSLAAGVLAVCFGAVYLSDVALTKQGGAPAWWPRLRLPPTVGAMASLLLAMLG
jgi:hypothetical protein